MQKQVMAFCVFLLSTIMLCGCQPFREGLFKNRQLNEPAVKTIAKKSTNIVNFANKIYSKEPEKYGPDFFTAKSSIASNRNETFWETDFFRIYCNEKNGKMYNWYADSNYFAFRNIAGEFVNITTCETGNEIESALIYEWYGRGSSAYPYEVVKTFSNQNYILNFFKKNRLRGYLSSNAMVTLPELYVGDSFVNYYSVIFNYTNNTNRPVEINLLNSYVVVNNIKYDLVFGRERNGQDKVEWLFYRESYGVFIGSHGNHLRFNPGQKIYGEFKFKIPGLTKIDLKDINKFEVFIDGVKCDNFVKVLYYDINKTPALKKGELYIPGI